MTPQQRRRLSSDQRQSDERRARRFRLGGGGQPRRPDHGTLGLAHARRRTASAQRRDGAGSERPGGHRHDDHRRAQAAGSDDAELAAVAEPEVEEALLSADRDATEGQLAPRYNALVRGETCADIAREIGLGDVLKLGRSEMKTGGRRKDALLGDAMEAVIAAVYLDAGLEAARAVIGLPHADFGEGVTAVVVCKPGADITAKGIAAALEQRLAKFKQPKQVFVVAELPRNTMGKVQKNLLREQYKDIFAKQLKAGE